MRRGGASRRGDHRGKGAALECSHRGDTAQDLAARLGSMATVAALEGCLGWIQNGVEGWARAAHGHFKASLRARVLVVLASIASHNNAAGGAPKSGTNTLLPFLPCDLVDMVCQRLACLSIVAL